MKFSYTLLKKMLPGLPNKARVIDALSMHSFEAEDAEGNTIDISLPPNRYSDAASHIGIANELSAIFGLKLDANAVKGVPFIVSKAKHTTSPKKFGVSIQDKKTCIRYSAQYFEGITVGSSPKWMQEVLIDCGMRPINNVVDAMNFVMLETGQPLHAFDYDKLAKDGKAELMVRHAKAGESMTSIDGIAYNLTPDVLVIADKKKPLVIAGVKGGVGCEVTNDTKRIIVESANFDFVSILKTSRKIGLATDASQRFSHNMSPALVEIGLTRAGQVLKAVAHASAGERYDSLATPLPKRIVKFDIAKFNKLIGLTLTEKEAAVYLKRLGFKNVKKELWEVPATRMDIETQEDLSEEVARLYGYQNMKAIPTFANLVPPETNDALMLRESIRAILVGFGFDEVYNHSFVAKSDVVANKAMRERSILLQNPTSAEFEYLRPMLLPALIKNVEMNTRYLDRIRLFEIGNVFLNVDSVAGGVREMTHLGLAIQEKGSGVFFELKGVITHLLKSIDLSDFYMKEVTLKDDSFFAGEHLELKSENKTIGYLGVSHEGISVAELDLNALLPLVEGEREFIPLQKYPTVMRDISMFVSTDIRIGELIEAIQESNLKLISDVDLVDEYMDEKWANLQSITLRVMFEAKDRTLTSEEVDSEMKRIAELLQKQFSAKLR